MDFSAPHAGYVIASYEITIVVLGALVATILLRQRRARAQLDALEARGGRRRPRAKSKGDAKHE